MANLENQTPPNLFPVLYGEFPLCSIDLNSELELADIIPPGQIGRLARLVLSATSRGGDLPAYAQRDYRAPTNTKLGYN